MDQQIPARIPDLMLIKKKKKKKLSLYGFCRFNGPQSENKSEKIDKYVDLARGLKKQ